MNYTGKLYGKGHGKTYFPLVLTSEDVDRMEKDLAAIEIQRNEWQAIAKEALASFQCTQRPENYPEGHWSRRAQNLLENADVMTRAQKESK